MVSGTVWYTGRTCNSLARTVTRAFNRTDWMRVGSCSAPWFPLDELMELLPSSGRRESIAHASPVLALSSASLCCSVWYTGDLVSFLDLHLTVAKIAKIVYVRVTAAMNWFCTLEDRTSRDSKCAHNCCVVGQSNHQLDLPQVRSATNLHYKQRRRLPIGSQC